MGEAFIFVSHRLCRADAAFFADFLDFSRPLFSKSGIICPLHRAKFAGKRKKLPGARAAGKISPEPKFLADAKSMFNRKLLAVGTSLAKNPLGKTPKERLL
jgi:hypothetical protein